MLPCKRYPIDMYPTTPLAQPVLVYWDDMVALRPIGDMVDMFFTWQSGAKYWSYLPEKAIDNDPNNP